MDYKADYCSDRDAAGGFGNMILYRMCIQDAPGHSCEKEIADKCWIIGRSYAASPERRSGVENLDKRTRFFDVLAKSAGWGEVQEKIDKLHSENHFGADSLPDILSTHRSLVRLIAKEIEIRHSSITNRTSFASKYLHFHKPDHFPIFDSIVSRSISKMYPRNRVNYFRGENNELIFGEINKYERFCHLVLEIVKMKDEFYTLRSIDADLYKR